jgi:hypothetical protein
MIHKESLYGFSEARGYDDLAGAASGHGGYCPEGVPVEFALLSILAAFGVAFGFLYRALTLTTGKRRKRELGPFVFSSLLGDLAWAGRILQLASLWIFNARF